MTCKLYAGLSDTFSHYCCMQARPFLHCNALQNTELLFPHHSIEHSAAAAAAAAVSSLCLQLRIGGIVEAIVQHAVLSGVENLEGVPDL